QEQFFNTTNKTFDLRSNYTEPLGKGYYLGLSYQYVDNNERPQKDFYDRMASEAILNESLSTAFKKQLDYHISGLSIRKNRKNSKLSLGLQYRLTNLEAIERGVAENVSNQFHHWLPSLNYNLDLSGTTSVRLSYFTNINVPSLNQLIPFPDNANPNLLVLGNPDLIPSYAHRVSLNFNLFDNFNFTNLYAGVQFSVEENRIVNRVIVDDNFIRTLIPINTNNFKSGRLNLSFAKPLKALGIKYRLSGGANFADYTSFLNDLESQVKEANVDFGITLENRKKEKLDIASGIKFSYNNRNYLANSDFNQSFFNYNLFLDMNWFLTESFTLGSSFDWQQFSGENFSNAQDFKLWNAFIEKTFNNNKWAIKFSVFDILKENQG
ncbi:MAG: TonB-dependent receptor, partial [Bacteroidota bacterium]